MAKVKYVLLLPLTYNDNTAVSKEVRRQIFHDLFVLAGGYHVAGKGKGAYRMKSGQKQVDKSLEVWVVINEQDEPVLMEMVAGFAGLLDQEAIYLEKVQSTIEFIPPKTDGA